jgi:geranylgeranyl diphosphate synthase, type I
VTQSLKMNKYRSTLAAGLENMFAQEGPHSPVQQMALYHLGLLDRVGGPGPGIAGKMVRPALCLALCEGLGGDLQDALPAALALELAHRSSLVFDDIQDRGLERNGRPTVWNLWGTEQALNAGLALSCYARLALQSLEPALARRVQAILERAVLDLCEGQHLDLGMMCPSLEEYQEMVRLKTGVLLGAACEAGAACAGHDAEVLSLAREFGENLGVAFQMRDDYLGVWGDQALIGKEAGDLAARKRGLPLVLAMARSEEVRSLAQQPPTDHRATRQLEVLVAQDQSLQEECRAYDGRSAQQAREKLLRLPLTTNSRQDLAALVWFTTQRDA